MVEKEVDLIPESYLATLLGVGFYLGCSIDILHNYGGWIHAVTTDADVTPERLQEDFQRTYPHSPRIMESYRLAPYASFENLLEIVYFTVVVTDIYFQALHSKMNYLRVRDDARKKLNDTLLDIFGVENTWVERIDTAIIDRSEMFAGDIHLATAHLQIAVTGWIRAQPKLFSKAAFGYLAMAFFHTYGPALVYRKTRLGTYRASCSSCGVELRPPVKRKSAVFTCASCDTVFKVKQCILMG